MSSKRSLFQGTWAHTLQMRFPQPNCVRSSPRPKRLASARPARQYFLFLFIANNLISFKSRCKIWLRLDTALLVSGLLTRLVRPQRRPGFRDCWYSHLEKTPLKTAFAKDSHLGHRCSSLLDNQLYIHQSSIQHTRQTPTSIHLLPSHLASYRRSQSTGNVRSRFQG